MWYHITQVFTCHLRQIATLKRTIQDPRGAPGPQCESLRIGSMGSEMERGRVLHAYD